MKKVKIKSVDDLNSLPEGVFEIEEWDLEAELLEEVDAKLIVKDDVVEVAVDPKTFEKVKEKKMVLVSS
jgi:hypothetical protein